MGVMLRKVKMEDIALIYDWRNDPAVRKMMFNTSELPLEKHKSFWSKKIKSEDDFSFIVEYEGIPAGIARLDKKEMDGKEGYEVDILIAPEYQNRGLGSLALQELRKIIKEKNLKNVFSRVKVNNEASRKIFEKNRFKESYTIYRYEGEK